MVFLLLLDGEKVGEKAENTINKFTPTPVSVTGPDLACGLFREWKPDTTNT